MLISIAIGQQYSSTINWDLKSESYSVQYFNGSIANINNANKGDKTPYEFYVLSGSAEDIQLQIRAFSNPLTYNLKLIINQNDLKGYAYKLYAPSGQLLTKRNISSDECIINLQSFQDGNYLLQVCKDQIELKTFKIVKLMDNEGWTMDN